MRIDRFRLRFGDGISAYPLPAENNDEGGPKHADPQTDRPPERPDHGDVWKDPATEMKFVWIPEGCFPMGDPKYRRIGSCFFSSKV